jgi:hypothetical protein
MDYPSDFPEHLRATVDAIFHRAEANYISGPDNHPSTGYVDFVKTVFFGFAEQCVRAAEEGIWDGERVRKALDDFLGKLLTRVYYDKFSSGKNGELSHASFQAELTRNSRAWPEWRAIHKGLERAFAMRSRISPNRTALSRGPAMAEADPRSLRDSYLASLPEKAKILDICWAARQHYCDWKGWLRGDFGAGSAPDRAFRAILSSGKAPQEYRKQPRPSKWR